MNGYRKEYKFIVGDDVLRDVKNRIQDVMHVDEHQNGDFYRIRSIYLDSPSYQCLRENQAGISTREKYRIRAYDLSENKISAEIKIRHNETISKMSADISRDTLESILMGDYVSAPNALGRDKSRYIDNETAAKTLDRYTIKIAGEHYSPAVIVDYERSAYIYEMCNVRITFDRNVMASTDYSHFFDTELNTVPAIMGGQHVLEIKYDEFLPPEIKSLLSGMGLERCSCSKYVRSLKSVGIS